MSVSQDPSWHDDIGETCDGQDVSAELLRLARSGQDEAFADLVAPHRRELHVHCYRILGSAADADDAPQETLLPAVVAVAAGVRRAILTPDLALPHRHQPLPEHAARPAPARRGAACCTATGRATAEAHAS